MLNGKRKSVALPQQVGTVQEAQETNAQRHERLQKNAAPTKVRRIPLNFRKSIAPLSIKRIVDSNAFPIRRLHLAPTTLTMQREYERERAREEQLAIRLDKAKRLAYARKCGEETATGDVWEMMREGDALDQLAVGWKEERGLDERRMLSARRSRELAEDVKVLVRGQGGRL